MITAEQEGKENEAEFSIAYIELMNKHGFLPVVVLDAPEPILGTSTPMRCFSDEKADTAWA